MVMWPVWFVIGILGGIGAIGGFINWIFDRGHDQYSREEYSKGENSHKKLQLISNVVFGFLGPILILGIYTPLSSSKVDTYTDIPTLGLAVSSLVLGIGGARVWSGEQAKRQLVSARANMTHTIRNLTETIRRLSNIGT